MNAAPERRASSQSGWVLVGLAALIMGGMFATSSVQPGAVILPILGLGIAPAVATLVAYLADRSGRGWGQGLGLAVGIVLVGLAALAEWFFWIGDFQGASYQKISTALIFAAIGAVAAAGIGLLATGGRGRIGVAALVLATVLLPAGVGQLMVWSSQQPQGGEPAASVPTLVAERDPLRSCGNEITPPDGPGPAEAAARRCLLEAFEGGQTGELRRDYRTEEGNPVAEILRVLADGSVELFVDATRDPNGSRAWERLYCDGLAPVEGAAIFELIGCGEATIFH